MRGRSSNPLVDGAVAAAIAIAVLLAAAPAGAQNRAQVAGQIKDLVTSANEDIESGSYDTAKISLLDALALAKTSGLKDETVARAHLSLGLVYALGSKDKTHAQQEFAAALALKPTLQPPIKPTSALVTSAFAAAKSQAAEANAEDEEPAPPPPPKRRAPPPVPPADVASDNDDGEPDLPARLPTPLTCPAPDEAPPDAPIVLGCVAQPDLQVGRVLLFYRLPGAETFSILPTQKSRRGWYTVTIPGKVVQGTQVQYYFEARDAADTVIATNGRNDSPNVIILKSDAPRVTLASLSARRRARSESTSASEDPLERVRAANAAAEDSESLWGQSTYWIGLGVGTGYGWASSRPAWEWRQDVAAPAGAHPASLLALAPEFGYRVNDRWAIALTGRNQIIPTSGADTTRTGAPAPGAQSLLLRGLYFIGGAGPRAYVSAMVGAGEGVRLVTSSQETMSKNDTVRIGPVLAGLSVGAVFPIGHHFALTLDARGLAGFGDFGIVGDGTVGAIVAF